MLSVSRGIDRKQRNSQRVDCVSDEIAMYKKQQLRKLKQQELLTISFHGDHLQIPTKITSIQTTYRKPITISSHCHQIRCSQIWMFVQRVFGSGVEVSENFGKATSGYATTLIRYLQVSYIETPLN